MLAIHDATLQSKRSNQLLSIGCTSPSTSVYPFNYSVEAVHVQLQFTLSPRMAAQLKWNRTVNIHGRPGKNVSSDLHMEHLNRECKNAISSMGANITGKSIQKVGRAIKCSVKQYTTLMRR